MAVHDGMPWVLDAMQSVLGQTARDLELIVVDDGSTDETPRVLRALGLDEPRLRAERQVHAGLTRALNRALALARAPLVARLDADDVAQPERLACQRAFLEAHPEVGLLGTAAREVDSGGLELRVIRPPEGDAALRRSLIRRNPFVHSSMMVRRALVEQVGGYDTSFPVAQDYDLWLRLSAVTRMASLPEPLVIRRLVPGRVTASREDDRLRAEARARWHAVRRGGFPPWCVVFALRPVLALAVPPLLRRALRRALAH
jgi:glycosyltransferase involved in cell wall biosynthesis